MPYVRQDDGGGGRERRYGRREGSRGNGIGNPTSESSLIIPQSEESYRSLSIRNGRCSEAGAGVCSDGRVE